MRTRLLIIFPLGCCKQISRYFSDPQYYFQVNDHYVKNKLKVVLFPFLHRVRLGPSVLFIVLSIQTQHVQLFQSLSGSLDKNHRASGWQTFLQTPYLRYKCSRLVHTLYGIWYLCGACWLIIRSSWKVSLLNFLFFAVSCLHSSPFHLFILDFVVRAVLSYCMQDNILFSS